MKKVTLEELQKQQKRAEKVRKANGNRAQIWYNAESGNFEILELLNGERVVSESKYNFLIPSTLNYMDFETDAERKSDLLKRTKEVMNKINALEE